MFCHVIFYSARYKLTDKKKKAIIDKPDQRIYFVIFHLVSHLGPNPQTGQTHSNNSKYRRII